MMEIKNVINKPKDHLVEYHNHLAGCCFILTSKYPYEISVLHWRRICNIHCILAIVKMFQVGRRSRKSGERQIHLLGFSKRQEPLYNFVMPNNYILFLSSY